uniref:Foot protein-6 variant-1 n=1 Tax=Mytilus californianus TaxID=6549 RepID=Q0H216_MYTCA|nr:foot protein-6 variant-1 [Mytilus californianus]
MKSIQMILAVFVITALCGIVESGGGNYRGYCSNKGCRSGYIFYDNRGFCKYGSSSYKYDCGNYAGCCLPRNPYGRVKYYCTKKYSCPDDFYYYNNKGYYYYNDKDYFNCGSYNGCCLRSGY